MFLNYLKIKNKLFRKKCCFCNKKVDSENILCNECKKALKIYSESKKCALCNRSISQTEAVMCSYCRKLSPSFDQAIALYSYKDVFEKTLLDLKFQKRYSKIVPISKLMVEQFEKMNVKCDFIVPVPTVLNNYISRDYCSSCEMAYRIGKECSVKVYDNMLIKKKAVQQSALKFEERYENVKGMYGFNKRYKDVTKGKNILLVDDVITSGATLSECARVLKENGAARVYAVCLLYGGDMK